MKNIKLLKNALCLILIFSMLLTLFGCTFDEIETENFDTSDTNINNSVTSFNGDNIMDYKIQEIDGEYYIAFDDISRYIEDPLPPGLFIEPITYLTFKNVGKMQNAILNGNFTYADKAIIANYFSKDDNGVIIPDPYNVYLPVFPDETVLKCYDTVTLLGRGYSFDAKFLDNDDAYIVFTCLTKKHYNTNLEYAKSDIQKKYKVWEKEFDDIIGEKEVANLDNRKIIQYTLSNEDKTMFVIEEQKFVDSILNDYKVKIFYESNGVYFYVFIGNMDKPLSPEWLFQFDVQRYVPDQNS